MRIAGTTNNSANSRHAIMALGHGLFNVFKEEKHSRKAYMSCLRLINLLQLMERQSLQLTPFKVLFLDWDESVILEVFAFLA